MFFGNKRKNTELEIQIYDAIEKIEALNCLAYG